MIENQSTLINLEKEDFSNSPIWFLVSINLRNAQMPRFTKNLTNKCKIMGISFLKDELYQGFQLSKLTSGLKFTESKLIKMKQATFLSFD